MLLVLVTLVVVEEEVGEVGLEDGLTRRARLVAGCRTGEVLAEETGETLFLLAEAEAEALEDEATLATLALLVPLGGAGERMGFLRHTLATQAFFLDLFVQNLQMRQSAARQPLHSPHLPLLLLGLLGCLGSGMGCTSVSSIAFSTTTKGFVTFFALAGFLGTS